MSNQAKEHAMTDQAKLKTLTALKALDLGNSVAEFDGALERYFVETEAFSALSKGKIDIVAGDKGTGKTALYRILKERYATIEGMEDVEIVPAFNVQGSPIFQRMSEGEPLTEGQYITLWKAYFISLAGNWLLTLYEDALSDTMFELKSMLRDTELLRESDSPSSVFTGVLTLFRRLTNPESAEMAIAVTAEGLPVTSGRITFRKEDTGPKSLVPHDEALELLNRALLEANLNIWLIMDRLDEAFAGLPSAEIPALRALLRTYLDLTPYSHLNLKLFLRRDLFRRIVGETFVNLSHVNARRYEIRWDDESLRHLFDLRLKENEELLQLISSTDADPQTLFGQIFPEQVDPGDRKPITWAWIMSRIRDGNDVKSPRNLLDLIARARESAIRTQERLRSAYDPASPLLTSESIKQGLRQLSELRVLDTLLAEAGTQSYLVDKFRNGKAEHNMETLQSTLEMSGVEFKKAVQFLQDIGFLESVGATYKIPMLYRDGLGVTQGKAFAIATDHGESD
jgi:hypothetical protein